MKKLIMLLALMLTITTVKAQDVLPSIPEADEVTHMKFMGLPMDCDAETFSKRLVKEKGLVKGDYGNTDQLTLKGTFSGYKNCFVIVGAEGSGNVENVGVIMPTEESFSLLKSQYQTLKLRLITKYGRPETEEEGYRDYEPSTDYGRMRELREGNAKFETMFLFKEGMIKLMMTSVDYTGGYIQLIYIDFKNSMKSHDRTLDDL